MICLHITRFLQTQQKERKKQQYLFTLIVYHYKEGGWGRILQKNGKTLLISVHAILQNQIKTMTMLIHHNRSFRVTHQVQISSI